MVLKVKKEKEHVLLETEAYELYRVGSEKPIWEGLFTGDMKQKLGMLSGGENTLNSMIEG